MVTYRECLAEDTLGMHVPEGRLESVMISAGGEPGTRLGAAPASGRGTHTHGGSARCTALPSDTVRFVSRLNRTRWKQRTAIFLPLYYRAAEVAPSRGAATTFPFPRN
jgi:hypothetical protein